jgi:hypothetical protein
MTEEPMLLKNPPLTPDQDYAFLRSEGLKYIEELGSRSWTDYNTHDPGITILEALCYAITELGYRSSLPIKDLLTEEDGKISGIAQTLFTAKNILTQSPLTINDYRKLLIDIIGVHNAWLFCEDQYTETGVKLPAGEVPIYADCGKDALSYELTPHPVLLSGLYRVLLDLDNDAQFGDLNNGDITVLSPGTATYKPGEVSMTVNFRAWNEAAPDLLSGDASSVVVNAVTVTPQDNDWKISIDFDITGNGSVSPITLDGRIVVDLQPANRRVSTADVQSFFTPDFARQVANLYVLKIQKALFIVQAVKRTLNQNRNLCEDFVSVTTVKDEEIAICCDIEVRPDADMEKVQAAVFFAIEEYLNPSVRFYLLKELVEKGRTTDEIFEGPVLQHGFLDTAELEATQLRQEIRTSDIINLLMDIDGVLAVRGFRMTKYDQDGNAVPEQTGKTWCMPITLWHKPVFSETKSKILFFKNGFPYLPGLAEVRDTLRWLRAIHMRNKLTGHADDLPLPDGRYYLLDAYTSVQYLFPQTYGIGKAGLPASATDTRKGQAKQLKAYLLFYDQLLADFFSQLKNARNLFSTDAIVQTYAAQFLSGIKDIDPVYRKAGGSNLLQLLLQTQDSTVEPANEWQALYETQEQFLDRRNRFLDHLMARFAESFNDYVLLMYSLDFETQQETRIEPAALIDAKIAFLKDYPQIGYERGRAFNYFPQRWDAATESYVLDTVALWDTDNVSGLEKKAARLAGIQKYFRRFLHCAGGAAIITTEDTPPKLKYQFSNENGNVLTAITAYDTEEALNNDLPQVISYLLSESHFGLRETSGHWNLYLIDDEGANLAVSNDFADKAAARAAREAFVRMLRNECNNEGLHLIEHILLRPRSSSFALAPVCLDPGCDFCGEQDPYSFRVSVVLPYWPAHFRSMPFRNYFENMIRREAPAHLMVKVCWVDNASLYRFETAYRQWLTALAGYAADPATVNDLQAANDALLEILYNLHSEYPAATLHDCDESENTNPVMLGKTILGSFKM